MVIYQSGTRNQHSKKQRDWQWGRSS